MTEVLITIPVTVLATIIGFSISSFLSSGWEARRRYQHLKAALDLKRDVRKRLAEPFNDDTAVEVSGLLSFAEIESVYKNEKAKVSDGDKEAWVEHLQSKGMSQNEIDAILKVGYRIDALKVADMRWWKHWIS